VSMSSPTCPSKVIIFHVLAIHAPSPFLFFCMSLPLFLPPVFTLMFVPRMEPNFDYKKFYFLPSLAYDFFFPFITNMNYLPFPPTYFQTFLLSNQRFCAFSRLRNPFYASNRYISPFPLPFYEIFPPFPFGNNLN